VASSLPQGQPRNWTERSINVKTAIPKTLYDVYDDSGYVENDNAENEAAKRFIADMEDQVDDSKMEEAEKYESDGTQDINKQDKQCVQEEEAALHANNATTATKASPTTPAAGQPTPAVDVTSIASQFMNLLGATMAKLKTHLDECTRLMEEKGKLQHDADTASK
jgi:small-conductance mechanosensitive channel